MLSTEEAAVELGPPIDKIGAVIPKMGLLGSKNGKGWYDGPNESLPSLAEGSSIQWHFLGEAALLASGSMVKVDGLKRHKGVRLYNDSPEPTSGSSPQSLRDLRRGHESDIVKDCDSLLNS